MSNKELKALAEVLHIVAFESIYETAASKYGERLATPLLAEIMATAFHKMAERELVPFDISNGYAEVFATCYTLLQSCGFVFEEEVLRDDPTCFSARITECPHITYTRREQHNCAACLGIKMGAFRIVTGKQPAYLVNEINLDDDLPLEEKEARVEEEFVEKHSARGRAVIGVLQRMATGSPDCRFYIRLPAPQTTRGVGGDGETMNGK
ncbi:MAG: hypothetical protein GXP41_06835 [Chloroflexi bacterium]|nr:hypothetical protein [Chloroflexota bacterium]